MSKKFRHRWHGPFRICVKLSPVHYQIRTCDNRLIATTVHANRMKPFYDPSIRPIHPPPNDDTNQPYLQPSDLPDDSFEPDAPQTNTPPEPASDVEDEDTSNGAPIHSPDTLAEPDVHAAKQILKTRQRNGKDEYLVQWIGYPRSQSTWEPEENILDPRLLEQFRSKNK